jgi:hypothetical protein
MWFVQFLAEAVFYLFLDAGLKARTTRTKQDTPILEPL